MLGSPIFWGSHRLYIRRDFRQPRAQSHHNHQPAMIKQVMEKSRPGFHLLLNNRQKKNCTCHFLCAQNIPTSANKITESREDISITLSQYMLVAQTKLFSRWIWCYSICSRDSERFIMERDTICEHFFSKLHLKEIMRVTSKVSKWTEKLVPNQIRRYFVLTSYFYFFYNYIFYFLYCTYFAKI